MNERAQHGVFGNRVDSAGGLVEKHQPTVTADESAGNGDLLPLPTGETYLGALADEATGRGYRFDWARTGQDWSAPAPPPKAPPRIQVPEGQLRLEAAHLAAKIAVRSPTWWEASKSDPGFGR